MKRPSSLSRKLASWEALPLNLSIKVGRKERTAPSPPSDGGEGRPVLRSSTAEGGGEEERLYEESPLLNPLPTRASRGEEEEFRLFSIVMRLERWTGKHRTCNTGIAVIPWQLFLAIVARCRLNFIFGISCAILLCALPTSCSPSPRTVTVYAAQDQVFAEPILRRFEQETGIRVRAVYDSEAVKTVGLANRLLAERDNPQCDVFWGNEEFRTRQLAARGTFRETNGWAAFGYRSRRIVLDTNRWPDLRRPAGLLDLTNAIYRGKISMAYPLFGTTATHFMALRTKWGEPGWKNWCRALAANEPFLEEGNSHVPRRLARGEALIGLTDSDDLAAAHREGVFSGLMRPLDEVALLIPNTVAVLRNAPHPQEAQALFEYLQSNDVAQRLVEVHALEGAENHATLQETLRPDWTTMIADLEAVTEFLQETFLR